MWGPSNSVHERGLTPRVFERLFSRIDEEQQKHLDKQLYYHCRCSFLEIYNEQIMDLLDPNQRNLQIREDVRTGVYVHCLLEEYVSSVKDVIQLLTKGLANRRTGATSVNAESSRSHCVFTCIVESHFKSMDDGITSLKISRINLVDLAGSERQKLTGAAGERLKEAGNINRSLSQLGNVINILAEISQTGKQRHIPYRDSKLTFLLQESLGGNAKLAMVCAISPSHSCRNESFSTLRFAQRAKAIKNKAVINEISQDDVQALREQIRQLKDELLRMKNNGSLPEGSTSFSTGWSARRSLNLLRMSLGQRGVMSSIEDDMDIDDDVEIQSGDSDMPKTVLQDMNAEGSSVDGKITNNSEAEIKPKTQESHELDLGMSDEAVPESKTCANNGESDDSFQDSGNISNDKKTEALEGSDANKCTALIEAKPLIALVSDSSNSGFGDACDPISKEPEISLNLRSSPNDILKNRLSASADDVTFSKAKRLKENGRPALTERLAASLQHGLHVINSQRQKLTVTRSLLGYPFKTLEFESLLPKAKLEIDLQAVIQNSAEEESSTFVCTYCRDRFALDSKHETSDKDHEQVLDHNNGDGTQRQIVMVDAVDYSKEIQTPDEPRNIVPKAVEKVLAGAIRREMALQEQCSRQNAEILQLKRLIQQYKHERECNAVIAQTREDKICRLENLMDGILPTENFMEEEFISLEEEHKILKDKYDNHPDVLRANIELKRVQDELDVYRRFFDFGEREVLIEEITELRNHLQSYITSSPVPSQMRVSLLQLEKGNPDDTFEEEKRIWAETESKWISLTEELEAKLEATRSLGEKLKIELESEKKCSDELKEALQTAMKGHARILEQYADLQEKHITMLVRHQRIIDGIEDVKKAAAKAGVKGEESRFINSLASQISALKVEREKERKYWREEIKVLQAQLRDTAEAVQAAGELVVRLKDAEEAVAIAQKRAKQAEKETDKAHREIDNLKKIHEKEIKILNQRLAEASEPKEKGVSTYPRDAHIIRYDSISTDRDQNWRDVFEQQDEIFSRGAEKTSWFSGYDQCNV
ncbi:kinesin-like protein KIN-12B isoform X2 [Wolffia australiana]